MSGNKPSIPSGTRDFLPKEMAAREFIFDTLRKVFRKYGYLPLETPSMENLSVLLGKYGEEGDRLIFKILNSGNYVSEESLPKILDGGIAKLTSQISEKGLRYDLTVPFARAVVMNQNEIVFPFRRYQIQPVWRADRPQKGRYREFYQCDCDVIGSDSLLLDSELAAIYDEAFFNLGFKGIKLLVNNRKILTGISEAAGCPDKFTEMCTAIDKLDKIGEEKVKEELTTRGISELGVQKIFTIISFKGNNEEKISFLEKEFSNSPSGTKGIAEIKEFFKFLNGFELKCASVEFDLTLARGLNYYTGTIYEVKAVGIEYGSLGGGGRYDDLTGVFGLKGMSGVGVSFGADRIYDVMKEAGLLEVIPQAGTKVLIANFGGENVIHSLKALSQLRAEGIASEIFPDEVKMGKQFTYADKKKIPFVIVIGENEIKEGKWLLKNLASGEQELFSPEECIIKIKEGK